MGDLLIERLRNRIHDSHMDTERLLDEAADEITRLRAEVERLTTLLADVRSVERELDEEAAEVEALRALLNEAWPYVGSNLQERIDAAIEAQKEDRND